MSYTIQNIPVGEETIEKIIAIMALLLNMVAISCAVQPPAQPPMADAARVVWQNSQAIQIKRMEPIWTGRGKLLPLHIQRNIKP